MACELCYCCKRPMNGDNRLVTFVGCNHRIHRACVYNTIMCPCLELTRERIRAILMIPPHFTDQDSFLWNGVL